MPRGKQYLTPKEMAKEVFIFHADSNPLIEDSEPTSELSREEYHDRTVTATIAVGRTASTLAIFAAILNLQISPALQFHCKGMCFLLTPSQHKKAAIPTFTGVSLSLDQ